MEISGTSVANVTVLLYLVTFLGLAAFSAWDIKEIINDYINENRMVTVKRIKLTDRFPYLNKSIICQGYNPGDFLFPVKPVNQDGYREMLLSRWRYHNTAANLSEPDLTIANGIFDIVLPFMVITNMEKEGIKGIHRGRRLSEVNISESEMELIVDKFLMDPESINITMRASSKVRPMFVIDPDGDNKGIFPTGMHNLNSICFQVSLADKLTAGKRRQPFALDLVRRGDTSDSVHGDNGSDPFAAESAIMISLHLSADDRIDIAGGPNNTMTVTTLVVSNSGVLDSSRFPPCTDQFETVQDCMDDLKMRTIAEVCNCTQFSRFLTQTFRNRVTEKEDQNFCTAQLYRACWEPAMVEVTKRQEQTKLARLCEPCVYFMNTYTLSTIRNRQFSLIDGTWFARAYISFEYKDSMYLLLEETPKFNPSQFVSQIGGDLGLYIGFSMVSVLQLLIFCFQSRLQRRGCETDRGDRRTSGIKGWFLIILANIKEKLGVSECDVSSRRDIQKHDDCLKEMLKRMEILERKRERNRRRKSQ